MINIVQKGDPVLRHIAKPVDPQKITSPEIGKIIANLKKAITEQDDAVAIAAPQIGQSVRIFVIAGAVLSPNYPDLEPGEKVPADLVCVNPEITKFSRAKQSMTEGCLSVRWLYGTMKRSSKAMLKAYDENGQSFTRGGSGLLAQIFQHEVDHLNGILFTDHATDIEDVPPEDLNNLEKK